MFASGLVLLHDVGAGDVGRHQVGRELHAAELHVERARERAGHQRFAQARHPVQQHVAPTEHAHHEEIDDLGLSDDHAADFVLDPFLGVGEFADGRGVVVDWVAIRIDRGCGHGLGFGNRHGVFLFSAFSASFGSIKPS